MQSQTAPVGDAEGAKILASKPYLPDLQRGQMLRFHVVANPVKTIRDGEGRLNKKGEPKSCRVPLIKEDQQIAWLQRKLLGVAEIENVQAVARNPLYFRKKDVVGKIATVAFDGILRVDDPERMTSVLMTGIGPAKSFGCGLLSIARL
jgi:CRISPR system Cascade subunit CasE